MKGWPTVVVPPSVGRRPLALFYSFFPLLLLFSTLARVNLLPTKVNKTNKNPKDNNTIRTKIR